MIQINTKFCKGCGICVAFCPKKVFEYDTTPQVARAEDCSRCYLCMLYCPDFAIEIE